MPTHLTDGERSLLALVLTEYAPTIKGDDRALRSPSPVNVATLIAELEKFTGIVAGRAYIAGRGESRRANVTEATKTDTDTLAPAFVLGTASGDTNQP